jgi:hypothetical protein
MVKYLLNAELFKELNGSTYTNYYLHCVFMVLDLRLKNVGCRETPDIL